ncbi:hypothetical protein TSUD_190190 [Trifolium subterraneum]|uniref:Reverse transcriptase domain-containing protein n=1 Tax=Trifolium subterraneum TaxID=3900 RepID=A0A2Z6NYT6_TRISU|nr:hypothetical protein TSUD_190190 [Trifolium subterraneum]
MFIPMLALLRLICKIFNFKSIILDQLLVEQVIPNLVGDNVNALLTIISSADEIKHVVFDLNKDGAPGPDGFGVVFFQTYWDIIHEDVVKVVLKFFSSGDPLSPILFCLAEEVLSRGISNLVHEGKIDLIKGSRNSTVPSHCLYADDVMVFCKGKFSSLQALHSFTIYANCSGQVINASKSTIFAGGISQIRLNNIVNLIGFKVGSLPFNYLGIPIFKGRPKARYFYPIADRIKAKLSAWKASFLSIAGRAQLVKSVIQSMLVYSISVYSWPISLLKSIETWSRNFIWSSDINKRKLVTVAWKKICVPYSEGGLGLRSLISLNEAANLKQCLEFFHSEESWALILRDRALRNVGNGKDIKLWEDSWCGEPLIDTLQINNSDLTWLPSKVSDILLNHSWNIPADLDNLFAALKTFVRQVTLSNQNVPDKLIWKHNTSGELSMKDAYEFKRLKAPQKSWAKIIWCMEIPPSKSLLAWRLMQDKILPDDKLMERGCTTTFLLKREKDDDEPSDVIRRPG